MDTFKETTFKVDFSGYLQQIRTMHAMQTCAIAALGAERTTEAAHEVLTEIASRLSQLEDRFEEIADEQNEGGES